MSMRMRELCCGWESRRHTMSARLELTGQDAGRKSSARLKISLTVLVEARNGWRGRFAVVLRCGCAGGAAVVARRERRGAGGRAAGRRGGAENALHRPGPGAAPGGPRPRPRTKRSDLHEAAVPVARRRWIGDLGAGLLVVGDQGLGELGRVGRRGDCGELRRRSGHETKTKFGYRLTGSACVSDPWRRSPSPGVCGQGLSFIIPALAD